MWSQIIVEIQKYGSIFENENRLLSIIIYESSLRPALYTM